MESLTNFINEALSKSEFMDIIDKYDDARKLDNLDSYYDDLIIGFSRREEINNVVVKSIGKGPYYVVGMDNWADLFDKKGITNILKKAGITRIPHWIPDLNGEDAFKERSYGFVDTTKINAYYKNRKDKGTVGQKDDIRYALDTNKRMKELGLTKELDDKLKQMTSAFDFKPIKLERDVRASRAAAARKDVWGHYYGGGTGKLDIVPNILLINGKLIKILTMAVEGNAGAAGIYTLIIPASEIENIKD
jgi:hypothetical protein